MWSFIMKCDITCESFIYCENMSGIWITGVNFGCKPTERFRSWSLKRIVKGLILSIEKDCVRFFNFDPEKRLV